MSNLSQRYSQVNGRTNSQIRRTNSQTRRTNDHPRRIDGHSRRTNDDDSKYTNEFIDPYPRWINKNIECGCDFTTIDRKKREFFRDQIQEGRRDPIELIYHCCGCKQLKSIRWLFVRKEEKEGRLFCGKPSCNHDYQNRQQINQQNTDSQERTIRQQPTEEITPRQSEIPTRRINLQEIQNHIQQQTQQQQQRQTTATSSPTYAQIVRNTVMEDQQPQYMTIDEPINTEDNLKCTCCEQQVTRNDIDEDGHHYYCNSDCKYAYLAVMKRPQSNGRELTDRLKGYFARQDIE